MSTAITFKNHHQLDNNHFRIKRMSVSPTKKKSEMPTPLPGASITLYGCKFGQAAAPKQNKGPEMLTFYGKLHLEGGGCEELLSRKKSVKESDLKQKFKKKGNMELNKVLQFEGQGRGLYKSNYPDLRVEGVRERKNRLM